MKLNSLVDKDLKDFSLSGNVLERVEVYLTFITVSVHSVCSERVALKQTSDTDVLMEVSWIIHMLKK